MTYPLFIFINAESKEREIKYKKAKKKMESAVFTLSAGGLITIEIYTKAIMRIPEMNLPTFASCVYCIRLL